MTVIEYYTKFKRLWDQLLNFEPFPECSCGAMKILSASHDKAYVMRFLMGLNENYETSRSQILMLDLFPSMSKVYSLVLQEDLTRTLVMELLDLPNQMLWLCSPIPKEIPIPIGTKGMVRKRDLFALIEHARAYN